MQILKQQSLSDNPKFPNSCKAIRDIKTGKGHGKMCDLVQEYAKEYADHEKIKMLVEMFNDGLVTIEAAVKKLGITEEKFMEYSEEYNRQTV